MEVRCGKCNKLFRVSDDKITGTGIKFPCTRCGTYVKITREEFEQYTVSRGAVSIPDLFIPMPAPLTASVPPDATGPISRETTSPEPGPQAFDLAAQATHEDVSEEKPPMFVEPDLLPSAAAAPKTEPAVELMPEPLMQPKPKTPPPVEPTPPLSVEPQSKPKLEPLFVPKHKAKPAPEKETTPEPASPAPPVTSPPAPPVQSAMPRKEHVRPAAPAVSSAAERISKGPMPSSAPSRAGRMILVLVVALIVVGLAAYAIYDHLQEAPPSPLPMKANREAPREIVSNEGLQILNLDGAVQANGDLFITGAIQNTTEKERAAWYVVAEVTNSQGAVLSRIRLLNGNQIYNRSDYEILAGRGVNVQELKANLQEKGVVIPPKGTVSFELRYLQPPAGIASFVAQALPFEPAQIQKEIAEEMK